MAEFFDVLTPEGLPSGVCKSRAAVHRDGDLHGSVHIWVLRPGTVLLQKRREDKDSFPGCFDVSSAGHVDAGEDFPAAALRELGEELGLHPRPEQLRELFTQHIDVHAQYHGAPFHSWELNRVYLLDPAFPLDGLRPQESEISLVRWFSKEEVDAAVARRDKAFCLIPSEWARIRAYL